MSLTIKSVFTTVVLVLGVALVANVWNEAWYWNLLAWFAFFITVEIYQWGHPK